MSVVALASCSSYDRAEVEQAVEKAVSLLGGIDRYAAKDENILLKPNILVPDSPGKCSTTHPEVLRAAAKLTLTTGARLSYGDSPGAGSSRWACKAGGYKELLDEFGIDIADFKEGVEISCEKGIQNKKFLIAKSVAESDGLISVCKMKTHGFQKITGAVKNQFGCIPGLQKGKFHVKIQDARYFARMLVDLNTVLAPRLYIMDAVVAMEGNGPRGGDPRPMRLIIASEDPVALDATAARLMNLDPLLVPTITAGKNASAGEYAAEKIEITGEQLDDFICTDFKVNRSPIKPYKPNRWLKFLNNLIVPKPYIEAERCIRCGLCIQVCPADPKALSRPGGSPSGKDGPPPVYEYKHCIRCYCCQEMCPESAVKTRIIVHR